MAAHHRHAGDGVAGDVEHRAENGFLGPGRCDGQVAVRIICIIEQFLGLDLAVPAVAGDDDVALLEAHVRVFGSEGGVGNIVHIDQVHRVGVLFELTHDLAGLGVVGGVVLEHVLRGQHLDGHRVLQRFNVRNSLIAQAEQAVAGEVEGEGVALGNGPRGDVQQHHQHQRQRPRDQVDALHAGLSVEDLFHAAPPYAILRFSKAQQVKNTNSALTLT